MAAPIGILPPAWHGPASILLASASAVVLVLLTGARWWWLLSIPLLETAFVGSFDALVVLLVLVAVRKGRSRWNLVAAAIAPLGKIYALIPMALLGRRSAVAAGVITLAITALVLPWQRYIELLPVLGDRGLAQAGGGVGSPWSTPILLLPTFLAVIALGKRDGAWLIVPALWPATQVHYSVFMVPVGSPILAAVSLLPVPAPAAVAVITLAIFRGLRHELDPGSWLPARWLPARWRRTRMDPETVNDEDEPGARPGTSAGTGAAISGAGNCSARRSGRARSSEPRRRGGP